MTLRHVLVVGASVAGLGMVRELRRSGYGGDVTLVGYEPERPYRRPELSKKVLLADDDGWGNLDLPFGDGLAVDVRLGVKARTLDVERRAVTVARGSTLEEISYDGLAICTGVHARTGPWRADVPGMYVLRSMQDSIRVRQALRSSSKVVIIGAGFIGLEVAAAARTLGLEVTIVESLSSPLARVLGTTVGARVGELHQQQGVRIICEASVAAIDAGDAVESVTLADGRRLDADMVVVAIGTQPATEWLASSGVPVADGVMCDSACAVPGAANIVAAGDVANWYNPLFETRMRVEHWANAAEQSTFAAQTLLNGSADRAFRSVPYFWSEQYGQRLQFIGSALHCDHVLTHNDARDVAPDGKFVCVYARSGRVSGAFGLNATSELGHYRRLIAARTSVAELGDQIGPLTEVV